LSVECVQPYTLHIPVLKDEVLNLLNLHPDGIYLDGTIGCGGHASAIQARLSDKGILIGLDGDEEAIKYTKKVLSASSPCHLFHDSYDNFPTHLKSLGFQKVDGMLLDLGLSSHQIDTANRGFSYQVNGPLDMRFNRSSTLTARKIVNQFEESKLRKIIWQFGEERFSAKIAQAIVKHRKAQPVNTTFELRDIVSSVIHQRYLFKSLSRVFQAFRIAVNRELESLQVFLETFLECLKVTGRVVIISYHSLEDRLVKQRFMELSHGCICPPEIPICQCGRKSQLKKLTRGVLIPGEEETKQNPRARSAKLRAAERIS